MSFTIDVNDHRSIKAIEIAADAGQWMRCRTADGEVAFGIQSSKRDNHYYVVTTTTCTCPDFRNNGLDPRRIRQNGLHGFCKHILAVQLHLELVDAVQDRTPAGRRRHLHLVPNAATAALAARYAEIFEED